jgi:hypothetical protein
MSLEEINEIIEVLSYFDGRKMRPLRFRWRGRPYQISHVHGLWCNPIGQAREYHYHVSTSNSGSFELTFNNQGFVWKLKTVWLDD